MINLASLPIVLQTIFCYFHSVYTCDCIMSPAIICPLKEKKKLFVLHIYHIYWLVLYYETLQLYALWRKKKLFALHIYHIHRLVLYYKTLLLYALWRKKSCSCFSYITCTLWKRWLRVLTCFVLFARDKSDARSCCARSRFAEFVDISHSLLTSSARPLFPSDFTQNG